MYLEAKADIRKRILQLLRNQKEEERLRKSLIIFEKLFLIPEFQRSRGILFYISFDGEVNTFEMMKKAQNLGKTVAAPYIIMNEKKIIPIRIDNSEEDLECGPYGIQQPRYNKEKEIKLEQLDTVIVPGVAFDKKNNRLGRGAGYYDRFLKSISPDISTIGLAFDFQVIDAVPVQDHDVPLTTIVVN